MIRARILLSAALLSLAPLLLAACGQKGDLRLAPAKAQPAQANAPARPDAPQAAPQPSAPASK